MYTQTHLQSQREKERKGERCMKHSRLNVFAHSFYIEFFSLQCDMLPCQSFILLGGAMAESPYSCAWRKSDPNETQWPLKHCGLAIKYIWQGI